MRRSFTIPILLLAAVCAAQDRAPLIWEKPGKGVYRIRVDAIEGQVKIVGSQTDEIHAKLHLQPRSGVQKRKDCDQASIQEIRIEATIQEDILHLNTNHSVKELCDEYWAVEVPSRMKVYVEIDSGNVIVQQVKRGIDVRSGAANIILEVPEGSVKASAGVGSIQAKIRGGSYSKVLLHSGSGRVDLVIDGYKLERERPPGSGDSLTLTGSGEQEILLEASVGDVELNLSR